MIFVSILSNCNLWFVSHNLFSKKGFENLKKINISYFIFSFSLCAAWCYSYTKSVEMLLNESYFCLKNSFVMISHVIFSLL